MRYTIIGIILLYVQLGIAQKKSSSEHIVIPEKKDTFEYFSIADTNYSEYCLPATFKKSAKWKAADAERNAQIIPKNRI